MVQIAICDDSIDELSHLVQLLNQYRTSKHLNCEYAAFQNGFELISALERGRRFDLYCLDIIMPAFLGIDVAREIRTFDKSAPIVFFTSSADFALASYSVNAVNYVLKPISQEKFFITFDQILERIKVEQEDAIVVKSDEGIQRVLLSNLVFAEVMGRSVFYHLVSGKVVASVDSFTSVCDVLLKHRRFVKTHRSYVVNMQHVDIIDTKRVTLQTLSSVPIAQGKSREIKEKYLAFQMEAE